MEHKIHWRGPCMEGSGYAQVMRDYVYWFHKYNIDINLFSVNYSLTDNKEYITDDEIKFFSSLENKKLSTQKDRILVNHSSPDIMFPIPIFKHNVGYSMWETDRIPEGAAEKCNQMECIITGSEFSKQAFINGGVAAPVYVIPHIVVPKTLPENKEIESITKNKLVFLSVFEWHKGKGYDVLLKGFIEAFQNDPNVILILKVNSFVNPTQLKDTVISYIKEIKGDREYPKIFPICHPIKQNLLMSLYRYAGVVISTSRREGFSLTVAQALVNSRLVIAPNMGGHMEFLNEENAVLINSEWKEIIDIEPERRNYLGQRWVEPDLHDFILKLKLLRSHLPSWEEKDSEEMRIEVDKVREKLSPKPIIDKFETIFNNL